MKKFLIRASKIIGFSFVSGVAFTFCQWWVVELNKKTEKRKELIKRRDQRLQEIRERRAEQVGFNHPANTPNAN